MELPVIVQISDPKHLRDLVEAQISLKHTAAHFGAHIVSTWNSNQDSVVQRSFIVSPFSDEDLVPFEMHIRQAVRPDFDVNMAFAPIPLMRIVPKD